ncbi:MAG: hypothetical protein DRP76_02045 [Candidatus Omnitrophota bacterium]|nr:MAG: hypothetical protein DRP76_02045 [Candidatus Omnitrophota bacterium]
MRKILEEFVILNLVFFSAAFSYDSFSRQEIIRKTLDKWEMEISIKTGYLDGKTHYQIQFDAGGGSTGKSKLEFPLGNWLYGAEFSIGRKPLFLDFEIYNEIWQTADKNMEDKDWTDDLLWSHTKSDAEVKIDMWDASLKYRIWEGKDFWREWEGKNKKGWLDIVGGYRYERFKYRVLGVRYIVGGSGEYYSGEEVLAYKVEYFLPYIGVEGAYTTKIENQKIRFLKNWGLGMSLAFSPYAKAKDRDDHILRNKLSHGDCEGWAAYVGLELFLETQKNWNLNLGVDYLSVDTEGKQSQYWYGDDPATPGVDDTGAGVEDIDLDIKEYHIFYWAALTYKF